MIAKYGACLHFFSAFVSRLFTITPTINVPAIINRPFTESPSGNILINGPPAAKKARAAIMPPIAGKIRFLIIRVIFFATEIAG